MDSLNLEYINNTLFPFFSHFLTGYNDISQTRLIQLKQRISTSRYSILDRIQVRIFCFCIFPFWAMSLFALYTLLGREGECGRGRLMGTVPAFAKKDHGNHKTHVKAADLGDRTQVSRQGCYARVRG